MSPGRPGRRRDGPSLPLPRLRACLRATPLALRNCIPGIYPVDKPTGVTSHDMVALARRRLGLRRVGHGGTLDPLATGLLLLLAGNATRLFDALQGYRKTYSARLRLGLRTDTQDITGTVLETAPVPHLAPGDLDAALTPFRGTIHQVPPMFSALKHEGQPLHRLARAGKTVAREPRQVTVHQLAGEVVAEGEVELELTVSKGFYVRTLIDDLGAALGCGATMTALRRTAIGPFAIEQAVAPEALQPGPLPTLPAAEDGEATLT